MLLGGSVTQVWKQKRTADQTKYASCQSLWPTNVYRLWKSFLRHRKTCLERQRANLWSDAINHYHPTILWCTMLSKPSISASFILVPRCGGAIVSRTWGRGPESTTSKEICTSHGHYVRVMKRCKMLHWSFFTWTVHWFSLPYSKSMSTARDAHSLSETSWNEGICCLAIAL